MSLFSCHVILITLSYPILTHILTHLVMSQGGGLGFGARSRTLVLVLVLTLH